jgi:5-methyltetrahydropteroyltriglutamate--homocysteine methyltransferase
LRAVEDAAILDALQHQRALGLDVVTDGEMRRVAWMTEFSDAVEGFAADYPVIRETRPDGTVVEVERHTKVVVGKLRQRRRLAEYESRS